MSERQPRALLADDHPMVLAGLRKLLEPTLEVVGEVMDGRRLLEAAERLKPDLVIADISMPGIDGIEATRRLLATLPGLRVLILSMYADPCWVRAAFEAGAGGYLTKTSAPEEIELAVREVLLGRFFVSPTAAWASVAAVGPAERPATNPATEEPLTPRETDVVRLVGRGLGNKDIARQLGVSVTTVRTHLHSVYDKLRPVSRVELALLVSHTDGAMA